MKPSTPVIHEGKTYPDYAVSLNSGPLIVGGVYTTAINLKLIPRRINEEGNIELLESHAKKVRFSDIRNQADERTLQAFGEIDAAIQSFINDKGL